MAVTAERLQVVVEAETSKAIKDLKKLDKSVGANTKSADKFGKLLKGGAIAGGLVVVGAAIAGVVKVGSALIGAFAEQEQAEARLNATLAATGGIAGITASELTNLASELQSVTKFGDEAIIAAESLLLTFKAIGKDVMPATVEAVLNVSEAMGTDLQSSAIQLGKALNDPTVGLTALQRVGITFSESQKETIKAMQATGDIAGAQTIILAELESQFGGVARAAADTATGSFTQLSNVMGDSKEIAGEFLSLALRPLAKGFTDLFTGINEAITAQQALNAVQEGGGNIEQLKIALEEYNEQLELRAENESNAKQFIDDNINSNNNLLRGNALLAQQKLEASKAEGDALRETIAGVEERIAAEQELIDTARTRAAEKAAADQAEADRISRLAQAERDAAKEKEQLAEEELATQIALQEELTRVEEEAGHTRAAFQVSLLDRQLEAEREAFEERKDMAEQTLAILTKNVGLIGEAFATGEDAAAAFGKAAILAVADVIDALAEQAIVSAAIAFATGNIPSAVGLAAAGVAAGIAAGAVRASANFQSGTGPDGFQVPQGFENDNFPVNASSGETVRVDRPGEGGGDNTVILEIDGRILGQIIGDLSDAGRVRINPRSVKGL